LFVDSRALLFINSVTLLVAFWFTETFGPCPSWRPDKVAGLLRRCKRIGNGERRANGKNSQEEYLELHL